MLSFLGGVYVLQIKTKPEIFATLYTAGNVVAMCGTMFLWGPCKQCKKMWDKERWLATTIFLVSMATTLVCAFLVPQPWTIIAVLFAIVFQFCAFVWYSASFIPCGRAILKKIVRGVCSCCIPK